MNYLFNLRGNELSFNYKTSILSFVRLILWTQAVIFSLTLNNYQT